MCVCVCVCVYVINGLIFSHNLSCELSALSLHWVMLFVFNDVIFGYGVWNMIFLQHSRDNTL